MFCAEFKGEDRHRNEQVAILLLQCYARFYAKLHIR